MHVLFLTDNFPPETNAPATRTYEHARRWVRAGHRVTVVTGAPNFPRGVVHDGYANKLFAREEVEGIEVIRVKTYISANQGTLRRMLDYLSFMVAGFFGAFAARRVDVVVATSPQFFTACAGWAVAALRRKRFVFEVRDLWPASIAAVGALRASRVLPALERVELFLYRRAWRVVVVTDAFRRDLVARGIDEDKVRVVTNGVDLDVYRPRERDDDLAEQYGTKGRFVVGYLGTHGMAHALENVLDAAQRLRDREDVLFLFVGEGAAKDALRAECERRGLSNVAFHGAAPKDAMPKLWSLCDLALVHLKDTPVFETVIPSKVFEAMGCGRPVLFAGPTGEGSRIVDDAGCGVCVPAEDPAALADAVRALAGDPARCAALGRAGVAAAARYGRDELAARLAAVLEDAPEVDGPSTSRPPVPEPPAALPARHDEVERVPARAPAVGR